MGIQQDAGKIFYLSYKMYLKKDTINPEKLLEITKMDGNDIDRAVKYLKDLDLIDVIHTLGNNQGLQHFIFRRITPQGINVAEDKRKFFDTFQLDKDSIEVNYDE